MRKLRPIYIGLRLKGLHEYGVRQVLAGATYELHNGLIRIPVYIGVLLCT